MRRHESKSAAVKFAIEQAAKTGDRMAIFGGGDEWVVAKASPKDIYRDDFIGIAWPDGGVDYGSPYVGA